MIKKILTLSLVAFLGSNLMASDLERFPWSASKYKTNRIIQVVEKEQLENKLKFNKVRALHKVEELITFLKGFEEKLMIVDFREHFLDEYFVQNAEVYTYFPNLNSAYQPEKDNLLKLNATKERMANVSMVLKYYNKKKKNEIVYTFDYNKVAMLNNQTDIKNLSYLFNNQEKINTILSKTSEVIASLDGFPEKGLFKDFYKYMIVNYTIPVDSTKEIISNINFLQELDQNNHFHN